MMRRTVGVIPFAATLLLLIGCDQTFEPLQESDRIFSMYGMLEAGADTQWIRVMAVRDSAFTWPGPIDATVTLEHLGTGRVVQLRDSIVAYRGHDSETVEDLWAHNFWTTEPIEPGASYRVVATRSDGATSTAVVPVPPRPERIMALIGAGFSFGQDLVQVDGVTHLAMVHLLIHVPPGCGSLHEIFREHLPATAVSAATGGPRAPVRKLGRTSIPCTPNPPFRPAEYWVDFRQVPPGTGPLQWFDLTVTVSGSRWPFDESLTKGGVSHSALGTNVEKGTGYVGGILRRTIPYETCDLTDRPPAFRFTCELIYDDRSAMLEGHVFDHCSGHPRFAAFARLSEIEGNKVRMVRTDRAGYFRIGALEPHRPYRWEISSDGSLWVDELVMVFGPAERRVRDTTLVRSCG